MTFNVPSDLSGGLYFFDGKRQTINAEKTFQVFEPHTGCFLILIDFNLQL